MEYGESAEYGQYGYDRDSYDAGYREGMRRREEQIERLYLELEAYKKRYEYILNLKTDELLTRPMEPLIIVKDSGNNG